MISAETRASKLRTGTPPGALVAVATFFLFAGYALAAVWTVSVGPGFSFSPQTVTIMPGDTVRWVWAEGGHTTTSGTSCTPDGRWDSGLLAMGATFEVVFPAPGSFPYYCIPHCPPMTGTVVVTQFPTVTAIAPASGPSSGGTNVTITGMNFQVGGSVMIGGVQATNVSVPSSTQITATTPAVNPGTLNDVRVTNPDMGSGTLSNGWFANFSDVPASHPFHDFVEKIFRNGITSGCGGGNYCPDASVSRDQMAAFILRALGEFNPPTPPMQRFLDVPPTNPFYAFIDRMAVLGITQGCSASPPLYCPNASVTRGQMAVFLLRAKLGSGYVPPPATGIFGDVPPSDPFAGWIEDLFNRGITAGCSVSPPLYCPNDPTPRGQMAVFLTRTFNLP